MNVSTHVGGAVHAEALVVEPIHLRDLPALVVAARQRDAVGVADFQRHLRKGKYAQGKQRESARERERERARERERVRERERARGKKGGRE